MAIERNSRTFLLFIVSVALPQIVGASVWYTVTDITPGGFRDINNNGQVCGAYPGDLGANVWQDGVVTDLGFLPGCSYTNAEGISPSGRYLAGYAYNVYLTDSRAVLWYDGVMVDGGTLAGHVYSGALDVNDSGIAVGNSSPTPYGESESLPIYWDQGSIYQLQLPDWATNGEALDINNAGQIVGAVWMPYFSVACIWNNGVPSTMGVLPGAGASWSRAINEAGQAGVNSGNRAALWEDGILTPLGQLPGRPYSCAYGINESKQIVGASFIERVGNESVGQHAFVWTNGVFFDLNNLIDQDPGWELQAARSINDYGQIVGVGTYNGERRRFLLTPTVPVPGAMLLGIIGVGVIAAAKRIRGV